MNENSLAILFFCHSTQKGKVEHYNQLFDVTLSLANCVN